MSNDHDDRLLAYTLELARRGADRVKPNPRVGAVIVHAGEIVATGYHHYYGGPHAEAVALGAAGAAARGATLYCNLEPCSYRVRGKHQPPCTEAIISAGIQRVVIGQHDPNPAVRGNGVRALRAAGISVEIATDPTPFLRENAVFNTNMALGRPFVHLKGAISLDGKIAAATGDSRWITGEDARAAAHRLRAEYDAVLVGRGTVETDDPLLTVRSGPQPASGQPRAVVLDSEARIPLTARLLTERGDALVVCTGKNALREKVSALEAHGAVVLSCPMETRAIDGVLSALWDAGIRSLLVEGGARVITSFLRTGSYDRLTLFIAPLLMGSGYDFAGDLGVDRVTEAVRFESVHWKTIGRQQCFEGFRAGWQEDVDVYRTD